MHAKTLAYQLELSSHVVVAMSSQSSRVFFNTSSLVRSV